MSEQCQTCGRYFKISSYLEGKACACPKPSAPFREPDEVVRELDETKYGEPSAPTDRDECGIPHMLSKPPKDAGAKYGWQICDEVQRFVSNSSEMQFVPIAAYEKLERELAEAKADLKILCDNKSDIDLMNHKLRKQSAALVALLQEWYDDDYDGCDLLTRTGEALAKFKEGK